MQLNIIKITMLKKVEYNRPIYYHDEANDDFSNTSFVSDLIIDENYKYVSNNIFYRIFSFLLYYLLALPILLLYGLFRGVRVKGRKNLRKIKSGYILYGNHTHYTDAFIGHVYVARPRRTYIISNKDSVSNKALGIFTKSLGSLPVSDTIGGLKNLNHTIKQLLQKKRVLVVYPEAHIWPYYTGLRPFPLTSFHYAVENNVPAVAMAVTYRKSKGLFKDFLKPRPTIHIGQPVYPKASLSKKENIVYLHDEVYKFIKEKTMTENEVALYDYIKIEMPND